MYSDSFIAFVILAAVGALIVVSEQTGIAMKWMSLPLFQNARSALAIRAEIQYLRLRLSILQFRDRILKVRHFYRMRRFKLERRRLHFVHFCRMLPLRLELFALHGKNLFLQWKKQIANFSVLNAGVKLGGEVDRVGNQAHVGFPLPPNVQGKPGVGQRLGRQ